MPALRYARPATSSGRRGAGAINRIEIDASTDEAGGIWICLPKAPAHSPVHIVVESDDIPAEPPAGWPPGWFGANAGAVDDPSFERASQGAYEKRDDLG